MIYHGYENGFRTLGRQPLLEPIEWTRDGWFHAKGGTLSKPMAKPRKGLPGPSGFALSDDFSTNLCNRSQHYVGQTGDLKARIYEHNSGKSVRTERYRPWHLVCYLGFAEERKAIDFERYLNSGSGKTFLRRHFI
jgi:xylan 1,4-beta-xylosidase